MAKERPRIVAIDRRNEQREISFCDIGSWSGREPPMREWAVRNRFPSRNVALLSGEGSVGKSYLLMQLGVAHVLGRDWLDALPEPGPFLYLNAEDEADELHRRLAGIAAHYGLTLAELSNDTHLLALAGEDAVLGFSDRSGRITTTPLFDRLREAVCDIQPKLIGLDTSADIFAANENDRAEVRQFIGLMRGLAMAANAVVIICTHPSLTGSNSGSGLSGSTAWHNSVRARAYMHTVTADDGSEPDKSLRRVEFMKSNYGPVAEAVTVRWRNGVFIYEPELGSFEKLAAEAKADNIFLALLERFNQQERSVSPAPSATYAPRVFAEEPEATGLGVKTLKGAMSRLFAANKIHVAAEGSPSRQRKRLLAGPKS